MTWAACYGHQIKSFITQGDKKNTFRLLVGKLVGKRHIGRPRSRWYDDIKILKKYDGRFGLDVSE